MGLRTVVAFRPAEVALRLYDPKEVDPFIRWTETRKARSQEAAPVSFALALGFLALLYFAVQKADPWAGVALSSMFIGFGAQLTCYYYAFVLVVALLYASREFAGRILLAATAATGLIGAWYEIAGQPSFMDERYTFMSVVTLAAFVLVAAAFAFGSAEGLERSSAPASTRTGSPPRAATATDGARGAGGAREGAAGRAQRGAARGANPKKHGEKRRRR